MIKNDYSIFSCYDGHVCPSGIMVGMYPCRCVQVRVEELLCIEAAEALHRLHQHQDQPVVRAPHLLPQLLAAARQLGEITTQAEGDKG